MVFLSQNECLSFLLCDSPAEGGGGGVAVTGPSPLAEGRSPGEPLAGPSAAPDGSPAEFGGQARGLGEEEVWDWNRHVLVTQGCEVPSLRLEDDPTELPFYLSSVRTFWTMKPGRSSSTPRRGEGIRFRGARAAGSAAGSLRPTPEVMQFSTKIAQLLGGAPAAPLLIRGSHLVFCMRWGVVQSDGISTERKTQ